VLRELATHPDAAQIIEKNPKLTKREARELMRPYRTKDKCGAKQENEGEDSEEGEWTKAKKFFRNLVMHAHDAYSELTGHKGGRVIADGRLAGRLFRLGREIDEIFGIKLFANKDSRRLR
jgi:hypothetical protein